MAIEISEIGEIPAVDEISGEDALKGKKVDQMLVSRSYGGETKIALRLAKQSRQAFGISPTIWHPNKDQTSNSQCQGLEAANVTGINTCVYDSASANSNSKLRATIGNAKLAGQLRSRRTDLIHVHAPFVYAALRHGLRFVGVPVVVHVHLDYSVEELRWALKCPPDAIITCADFLRDRVLEALPRQHRSSQQIIVVRNAVDLDRFTPGPRSEARRGLAIRDEDFVVLMLANLSKHKGQETAIKAIATLARCNQRVVCLLAGVDRSPDQNYQQELQQIASRCGVEDQIRFLGFRNDPENLLRAADVLLLPSTSEGLPLTILEAHAMGVPVVAAPTAGIPEVIQDGETGFLVHADDVDGYADRIRMLRSNAELCRRISNSARQQCIHLHAWSRYWQRTNEVYRQVIR